MFKEEACESRRYIRDKHQTNILFVLVAIKAQDVCEDNERLAKREMTLHFYDTSTTEVYRLCPQTNETTMSYDANSFTGLLHVLEVRLYR